MTHEIRIVGGGEHHRAECTCGWRGQVFGVRVHAERDGDEHQIQMARAGEGR